MASRSGDVLKRATNKRKYQYMQSYMDLRKQIREEQIPASTIADWSHYWSVKRKSKRGTNKWILVRYYQATKTEIANVFTSHFSDGEHKLVHHFSYEPSHTPIVAEHPAPVTTSTP